MGILIPRNLLNKNTLVLFNVLRGQATRAQIRANRSAMFDAELEKQKLQVPRIEKIEVTYKGKPEPYLLKMNKNISTPLDCTKHMVRTLTLRSALAMVDDEPWDMNRPLKDSCELKLLDFQSVENPEIMAKINKTFWRSCSFLLGKVIDKAFKEDFPVSLVGTSCPIDVESGSFVYDALVDEAWMPKPEDLRSINQLLHREILSQHSFERIVLFRDQAEAMFKDSPIKLEQLASLPDTVTVYRLGDYCDLSPGPMITQTGLIGRIDTTAIHPVNTPKGLLYRFQGIAIPSQIGLQEAAYRLILKRARKLNPLGLSWTQTSENKAAESVVH